MTWVTEHWDILLLLAGQVIATAAIVVKLTPSVTDDEWLAKIEAIFNSVKPKQ